MPPDTHKTRLDAPAPAATPSRRVWLRLAAFAGLFAALTVAGVWWASASSGLSLDGLSRLWTLPLAAQVSALAFAAAVFFTELVRFRVVGHALGIEVGWWAAVDATIANNFFAWLTPGAALSDPAAIYMLGRSGVPWDAAALLALGKSVTSMLVIMSATFACLAAGLGPELTPWLVTPFATGTGVVSAFTAALVLGAWRPDWVASRTRKVSDWLGARRPLNGPRARRTIDRAAHLTISAVGRLAAFKSGGWSGMASVLASHLAYYASWTGVFVSLAVAMGASPAWLTVPLALVYQCFTYVVFTPGGAGLSEAAAEAFFGPVMGAESALLCVLVFRALTFYVHILVGALYLPSTGAMRQILTRSGAASKEDGAEG